MEHSFCQTGATRKPTGNNPLLIDNRIHTDAFYSVTWIKRAQRVDLLPPQQAHAHIQGAHH